MQLPFDAEAFFEVFAAYNAAVWPAQVGLSALALLAVVLLGVRAAWAGALIAAILAILWAWVAVAYHALHFARINPAAYAFAAASGVGAAVFAWQGVVRRRMRFAWRGGAAPAAGGALVVYALVAYPVVSHFLGHRYPAMPTFGLPCPTTLFTIGVLAFMLPPYPRSAFAVPVLWCAVGVQAAFALGVPQDLVLGVAGVLGAALMARRRQRAIWHH